MADASSAAEETMRRRVSEPETDKATRDQRHAGVMKRAADEARRAERRLCTHGTIKKPLKLGNAEQPVLCCS
jgi:hypothetical protein